MASNQALQTMSSSSSNNTIAELSNQDVANIINAINDNIYIEKLAKKLNKCIVVRPIKDHKGRKHIIYGDNTKPIIYIGRGPNNFHFGISDVPYQQFTIPKSNPVQFFRTTYDIVEFLVTHPEYTTPIPEEEGCIIAINAGKYGDEYVDWLNS
jgi:hypothetical protein